MPAPGAPESPSILARPWAVPALAALAALLAHAGALRAGLYYDDGELVAENLFLRDLGNIRHLFGAGYFACRELSWRPVATLVHMLEVAMLGTTAPALHAVSVAWHAGNAALLAGLLRRLGVGGGPALVGATLFAVHPALAEAVLLVSFREDLVATTFVLAAAWAVTGGTGGWARAGAVAACTACAVGAKETGLVLPAVLALAFAGRARAAATPIAWRAWLPALVVSVCVCAGYAWLRFGPLRNPEEAVVPPLPGGPLGLVAGDLWILGRYAGLACCPLGLSLDHTLPRPLPVAGVALGVLALAAATGAAWAARRTAPGVAFGLGVVGVALLPVANLAPLSVPLAERFLYLPAVGLAWAVASAAPLLSPAGAGARRAVTASVALACALAAGRTQWRAADFVDEERLWRVTLAATPDSGRAHANLGALLSRRGDVEAALPLQRRAVELQPDEFRPRLNLASTLQRVVERERSAGRPAAADAALRESTAHVDRLAERHPRDWRVWMLRGSLADLRGDVGARRAHYAHALAVAPAAPEPRIWYARDLVLGGRAKEALVILDAANAAVAERPDYAAVLARARDAAGRRDEARRGLADALARWPGHAELGETAKDLGLIPRNPVVPPGPPR